MSKKRTIVAGRMTPAIVAAVVAEIEAYGRYERSTPLSWRALREFSGFSHVSLWKKAEVKAAFSAARQARRADSTPPIRPPKTADERIVALQEVIVGLRGTIEAYDELWALYEHNMHRLGINPDELRKPLDTVARATTKSRRVRAVR